jgi:Retrotransposon gag protein
VDARIDIPTYDGLIDAEKLDSWLSQLETYFDLYGYSSGAKVSFARLKLTNHALTWWNSFLVSHPDEEVSWKKFTLLIRKEFYPMSFEEDRWSCWHSLRQRRDQFVQDYTTKFRRLAISLGVSLNESSTLMK